MLATHKELARKLTALVQHLKGHDQQIKAIFEAIHQLMTPPEKPRKKIGFQLKERRATYSTKKNIRSIDSAIVLQLASWLQLRDLRLPC